MKKSLFGALLMAPALHGASQIPIQQTQGHEIRLNDVSFTVEMNTNRPGKDYRNFEIREDQPCKTCEDACRQDPNCKAFTYVKPGVQGANARCWLKSEIAGAVRNPDCVSGVKMSSLPVLGNFNVISPPTLPSGWGENEPKIKANTNLVGKDYRNLSLEGENATPQNCMTACQGDPECEAWTYVLPSVQGTAAVCWLKKEVPATSLNDANCISGLKVRTIITPAAPISNVLAISPEKRKQMLTDFNTKWRSIAKTNLGDVNLKLQIARKEMLNRQTKIADHYALDYKKVAALPEPIPYPSAPMDVFGKQPYFNPYRLLIKPGDNMTGAGIPTMDMGNAMKPPTVSGCKSITTDPLLQKGLSPNMVVEGQYVIIYGQNFGDCPDGNCGVMVERRTNTENVQFADQRKDSFDLIPFQRDWSRSWFNDFIVARIPAFKDSYLYFQDAELILWKGGKQGFVRKQEVNIKAIGPSIAYAHETPMYREGHLSPGATVKIYGNGFGHYQGGSKVELRLLERNKTEQLRIKTWEEGFIEAEVPSGIVPKTSVEPGQLIVTAMFDQKAKESMILKPFGPKMVVTCISGLEYMELVKGEDGDNAQETYNAAQEGVMMVVDHDPGCGWSGEDGEDRIFRRGTFYDKGNLIKNPLGNLPEKLPENVSIEGFVFHAVNPEDMVDNFSFAAQQLVKLLSDPYLAVGEWAVYGIISAFCPGFGAHKTEVWKSPSTESPMMEVHWENTCWMRYDGLHNIYTTSFILRGPQGYVPGEPK